MGQRDGDGLLTDALCYSLWVAVLFSLARPRRRSIAGPDRPVADIVARSPDRPDRSPDAVLLWLGVAGRVMLSRALAGGSRSPFPPVTSWTIIFATPPARRRAHAAGEIPGREQDRGALLIFIVRSSPEQFRTRIGAWYRVRAVDPVHPRGTADPARPAVPLRPAPVRHFALAHWRRGGDAGARRRVLARAGPGGRPARPARLYPPDRFRIGHGVGVVLAGAMILEGRILEGMIWEASECAIVR